MKLSLLARASVPVDLLERNVNKKLKSSGMKFEFRIIKYDYFEAAKASEAMAYISIKLQVSSSTVFGRGQIK